MSENNSPCLTDAPPVLLSSTNICNLGFFCPNNTVEHPPQFCQPTRDCQITRLQALSNTCWQSQGTFEPVPCAPGFYCPEGGKQKLPCPAGHYCPLGAFEPWPCDAVSVCPSNSSRHFSLTGVVATGLLDLLIVVIAAQPRMKRLWHAWRRSKSLALVHDQEPSTESALGNVNQEIEELQITTEETSLPLHHFVKSVQRCIQRSYIGLEIGFDQLGFQLQSGGRSILKGVSGIVKPGSLLGVMGPSGAGKSTFVRVMMGKLRHTSGTVYINGNQGSLSDFKKIIGYVPQDDNVMPELTVRENLLHSARIRLPRKWKEIEIQEHVNILLACLELVDVQNNLVGDVLNPGISGGQRRRTSIGIELASAPMALILDEPTSGLDAASALAIMKLLKAICQQGVTVVCIIHQPRFEIFQCLDRLLFFADGREIYFGKASDVTEYFRTAGFDTPANSNPADVIMDIVGGRYRQYVIDPNRKMNSIDVVSNLSSHWNTNQHLYKEAAIYGKEATIHGEVSVERPEVLSALSKSVFARGAPWHRQVYFCFLRSCKQQFRRLRSFYLEITVGALAGLLIGLSIFKLGGLFFQGVFLAPFEPLSSAVNYTLVSQLGMLCSVAIGLAAAAPGVATFGEEKAIFWREASSGHSRFGYFVGKVLSTLPRLTLSALHYTTFYTLFATPIVPFRTLYVINLLYFYCVYGLAFCVSMVTSREDGPLLATIVGLIIGVFGGYGPSLSTVKSWHLEWFWRVCPGTWLSEAFYHSHTAPLRYLYDIDAAAKWQGYTLNQMSLDIGMLFVIGTFYRFLAFAGLVWMNRDKQV